MREHEPRTHLPFWQPTGPLADRTGHGRRGDDSALRGGGPAGNLRSVRRSVGTDRPSCHQGREKRMSQLATHPATDPAQLQKLCTSIRGKLQFMDYLVRAAVADLERYQAEADTGTR